MRKKLLSLILLIGVVVVNLILPLRLQAATTYLLNANEEVTQIAAGQDHTLALTSDGRVLGWGYNAGGVMGDLAFVRRGTPTDITSIFNLQTDEVIESIFTAPFSLHAAALTSNNRLFMWGRNNKGQLGDGTTENKSAAVDITAQLNLQVNEVVTQVALGEEHTGALTSLGRVFMWGSNYAYQLGNNSFFDALTPIDITANFTLSAGESIIQLALGRVHSAALTSTGTRYFGWGNNYYYQLGDYTTYVSTTPKSINFNLNSGDKVTQLAMGYHHSLALTQNGLIYAWGENTYYQLGDGSTTSRPSVNNRIDYRFSLNSGEKAVQIYAGLNHNAIITSENRVFTWGQNNYGQVGNGTSTTPTLPVDITSQFSLASGEHVAALSLGGTHTYSLTSTKQLNGWGDNRFSQLGDGTQIAKLAPTKLSSISTIPPVNLTFNSNGGTTVSTISQQPGTALTTPTNPTKTDYTFDGWYTDSALTTPFTFSTMPAADTVLYAKWAFNYDVVFEGVPADSITPDYLIRYGYQATTPSTIASNTAGSQIYDLTIVQDLNNDGYDDFIIHNTSNQLVFFLNNQDGTFTQNTMALSYSYNILWAYDFADYDEDGDLDLFLAYESAGIRYLLNNGDGTFANPVIVLGIATNGQFLGLDVIDYDFDGDLDVFTTNSTEAMVYINNGSNSFTKVTLHTFSPYGRSILVADLNSDGINDVIFSNNYQTWYKLGNEDGSFGTLVALGSASFTGFALEDGNNNGLNEIVFSIGTTLMKYEWNATNQNFDFITSGSVPGASFLHLGFLKDVNNDGMVDFIANNTNSEYVLVLTNEFNSYVTETASQPNLASVNIADFNSTGSYSIFAPSTNSGTIQTFANMGTVYYLNQPSNPEKLGYTFIGWFNTDLTTSFDFNQPLGIGTTTLVAVWDINSYTLTFDSNGGSAIDVLTADFDSSITAPVDPTREGYTFGGWYSDEGFVNAFNFATMPAENLILFAKWNVNSYTLTFDSNGGSSIDALTIDFDSSITAPLDPTREGYTFGGWYSDEGLVNTFSFNTMPAENVTLFAKWNINQNTISFDEKGGSTVADITLDYGSSLTAPANPTRIGYAFGGWYSDEGFVNAFNFNTMPAENLTLFAKWNVNSYTVTYDSNGGSSIDALTADFDSSITAPVDPTREGYTFGGWYSDEGLVNTFSFNKMPAENVTLFAKWNINQYTISFDEKGGSTVADITLDYGSSLTAPSNPTREGYTFNGWSSELPTTMPAQNITIVARWLKVEQQSYDNQSTVTGLLDAIDPALVAGKDAQVSVLITVREEIAIAAEELNSLVAKAIEALENKNHGLVIVDISVLVSADSIDTPVTQLTQAITIQLLIPEAHRGYENYQVIRMHNGVAEVLTSTYNADTNTITFETDRFSTYAIAYIMHSNGWYWWLLLLLLIPLFFLFFIAKRKEEKEEVAVETTPAVSSTVNVTINQNIVVLAPVTLAAVKKRPQYGSLAKVDNGSYLEITADFDATNRVVAVANQVLPKLMTEENRFIGLQPEEVKQFVLPVGLLLDKVKFTPGSRTSEGYYVEVDLEGKATDHYIKNQRQLPPTTTKGHRWIRVTTRKIVSQ